MPLVHLTLCLKMNKGMIIPVYTIGTLKPMFTNEYWYTNEPNYA